MSEKLYRRIYGDRWFLMHFIVSLVLCAIYVLFLRLSNIEISSTLSIINGDTISLSAALAGFVFAGISIFISMEGSKKMNTIKSIGKANIIYSILIASVVFFVISLLLMGMYLTVLNIKADTITLRQEFIKVILGWGSIYSLLLAFVFFLSGLELIRWIFR